MDFISHISVADKDCHRQIQGKVSMNHIFSYQHYRFYQSGYSEDNEGSVFSVSHDPYGIGITYAGYTLLLLSTVFFFFSPQSRLPTAEKPFATQKLDSHLAFIRIQSQQ